MTGGADRIVRVGKRPHGGIIVIGAHRSGTTMTASLLRALGVHMGADCGVLEESAFFRGQNIRMLRASGASWYCPGPMRQALQDAKRCEKLAKKLRRALQASTRYGFPDGSRNGGAREIGDQPEAWGWKDPRSTVTLPLWRLVFPYARIVHIIRNGVDVAQSLMVRESKHPKLRFKPLRYLAHRVWPQRWPEFKWRPFRDIHEAFELWAEYVRFGVEATSSLSPNQMFQIRYEDFVADPVAGLKNLTEFLDITIDTDALERLSPKVAMDRRFAFATGEPLTEVYLRCRDHPMMRRFGYDHLPTDLNPPFGRCG